MKTSQKTQPDQPWFLEANHVAIWKEDATQEQIQLAAIRYDEDSLRLADRLIVDRKTGKVEGILAALATAKEVEQWRKDK